MMECRRAASFRLPLVLVPLVLVSLVLAPLGACAPERVAGDDGREPAEDVDEAAPFTETYWHLTSLLGEVVPAHELRHEPHLVFHREGNTLAGNGGCNWIAGTWDRQGSALEFAELSTTKMGCTGGLETERSFLAALASARSWRIVDRHLELHDAAGRRLASFGE